MCFFFAPARIPSQRRGFPQLLQFHERPTPKCSRRFQLRGWDYLKKFVFDGDNSRLISLGEDMVWL